MYVPFGAENQVRFNQFNASMGPNQLYFQDEPAADQQRSLGS